MKKREHNDKKPTSSGGNATSEMYKKYGRNVARAMNQRASSHKSGGRGR
jgi:hypothetical protein